MPSTSERQRKFMGAELERKRSGKKTKTGMTEKQMEDYASKPHKGAGSDHSEENMKERMKMMGGGMDKKHKAMKKKHK